jgi:hypothetical protein
MQHPDAFPRHAANAMPLLPHERPQRHYLYQAKKTFLKIHPKVFSGLPTARYSDYFFL